MKLRDWRKAERLTLQQAALRIGIAGRHNARTLHRYELGETEIPSIVVERIRRASGGSVTPIDIHETRMDWLGRSGRLPDCLCVDLKLEAAE